MRAMGFIWLAAWNPDAQAAMVEFLIEAGADPNAEDKSGVAPLHRAVRTRSTGALRALLANGADAVGRNKSGSTPLHLAVQDTGRGGSGSQAARQEQAHIIHLLLAHGARPSDRDTAGRLVKHWRHGRLDSRTTRGRCAVTHWPTAATPVTLHLFLGIGLVGLTIAFVVLNIFRPASRKCLGPAGSRWWWRTPCPGSRAPRSRQWRSSS